MMSDVCNSISIQVQVLDANSTSFSSFLQLHDFFPVVFPLQCPLLSHSPSFLFASIAYSTGFVHFRLVSPSFLS